MASPADPLINLRARTQIVQGGITRFMGETFQVPKREALGFLQTSEAEQVIDPLRPRTWMASAPGPMENFNLPGDFANQGSREGAIGNNRGGTPGDQQTRQLAGWKTTISLQPQQYDDYRATADQGTKGATGEWWELGATGPTAGAPTSFTLSPQRPEASIAPISGQLPPFRPIPPFRPGHRPPPERREGDRDRRDEPHRRRDDRDDRREPHPRRDDRDRRDDRGREAHHERREERYDRRHAEADHEWREDRYDRRHENDRSRSSREETGRRGSRR